MNIWLVFTLIVWAIIFFTGAWFGWNRDGTVPLYMLIVLILGSSGFALGIGASLLWPTFKFLFR